MNIYQQQQQQAEEEEDIDHEKFQKELEVFALGEERVADYWNDEACYGSTEEIQHEEEEQNEEEEQLSRPADEQYNPEDAPGWDCWSSSSRSDGQQASLLRDHSLPEDYCPDDRHGPMIEEIQHNHQQQQQEKTSKRKGGGKWDPSHMSAAQIKAELDRFGIDYSDCLDKQIDLLDRWEDVIANPSKYIKKMKEEKQQQEEEDEIIPEVMDMDGFYNRDYYYQDDNDDVAREDTQNDNNNDYDNNNNNNKRPSPSPSPSPAFRREDTRRRRRTGNQRQQRRPPPPKEEEPLMGEVQVEQQSTTSYSVSHLIFPGSVAELTAGQLQVELEEETQAPLLIMLYNKWFGPCLEMMPELERAAFRLGTSARVVKIDAERYPAVAQHLMEGLGKKIGLPTTLVMNGGNRGVLAITEGCLQTEKLLLLVEPFVIH